MFGSNLIISPIAKNIVFFVISFTLLFLPSLIRDFSDVRYWFMAIPVSIGWAYLLSLFLTRILKTIIYVILSIVTIIELFIILSFGTRFSALILRLLFETNHDEASGFFSQYVFPNLYYLIIGISLYVFIIIYLEKHV